MPRQTQPSIPRLPDRIDQRTAFTSCSSLSSLRASALSGNAPIPTMPPCSSYQTNMCSLSMSAFESQIVSEQHRHRMPEELLVNEDILHAVHNTLPLEERVRRAQLQRMKAARAVETVPISDRPAARVQLEVAELELRALDVEYARVEAEDEYDVTGNIRLPEGSRACSHRSSLVCETSRRFCNIDACNDGTRRQRAFVDGSIKCGTNFCSSTEFRSCPPADSSCRCLHIHADREMALLFYTKKKLSSLSADVTYALNSRVRLVRSLKKTQGIILHMRPPLLASISAYHNVAKVAHQRITDNERRVPNIRPALSYSSSSISPRAPYEEDRGWSDLREKHPENRATLFNSALAPLPACGADTSVETKVDTGDRPISSRDSSLRMSLHDSLSSRSRPVDEYRTGPSRNMCAHGEGDELRLQDPNDPRFSFEDTSQEHHAVSSSASSLLSSAEMSAQNGQAFWTYPDYVPVSTSTLSSGRSTPTILFSPLERSLADACYDDSEEVFSNATDTPSPTAVPASPHDIFPNESDVTVRYPGMIYREHDPYRVNSDFDSFCNVVVSEKAGAISCNDFGTPPASPLSSDSCQGACQESDAGYPVRTAMYAEPGVKPGNYSSVATISKGPTRFAANENANQRASAISFKDRVRYTIRAPRRTLARLQISRTRIPSGVKSMWTEANHQFIAAVAQKPWLSQNPIHARHAFMNLRGSDPCCVGILGPWLVRAPREPAVDLLQRILDQVDNALPVLEELIAQEECHVKAFERDMDVVSHLVEQYDEKIRASFQRPERPNDSLQEHELMRDFRKDFPREDIGVRRSGRCSDSSQRRALSDFGVKTFRALSSNVERLSFNPARL